MSELNDSWVMQIAKVSGDIDFQRDVGQIKSKALLKEISPSIPPVNWTYIESRILRTAAAMNFMIENIVLSKTNDLEKLGQSPLRLASLWENLGRLGEKTDEKKALMNAAIIYEIAGYQANAACLARKIYHKYTGENVSSIESLSSIFLQRYFLGLKNIAKQLMIEPSEFANYGEAIDKIGIALAAHGFVEASKYFLSGNEASLDKAKDFFSDSEKIFVESGFVSESNLMHGIRCLLPLMHQRSTWALLGKIVKDNQSWERYLKLLSRGLGKKIMKSPSVSELWPSQIKAIDGGLLDGRSNKIVKMPTSAGKTRIAELAIVHTLITIPNAKCVYVAPYRALVSELEQSFIYLFSDLGYKISSIVGSFEADLFEEQLVLDADILVVTPEKLDLLLRAQPQFLNNVRLFILDESHVINEGKRGIKFELLLTRLKKRLPNSRFLFLSAVFSEETLEEFARWFDSKDGLIESKWRPSIQRYAKFEWNSKNEGTIKYIPSDDNVLLQTFVPKVISQKEYEIRKYETGKWSNVVFPKTKIKSQTAAELAFKFSELGPVLVFCAQGNWVEDVAKSLQLRLQLEKSQEEMIPSYFTISEPTRSIMVAEEWLGHDHPITKFLKIGIAIHHGNLPEALKKSIETDYRERKFRVLIATNTLAQGVNLPIRTVIVHSCKRFINNRLELLPLSDYWNVVGRAGRAGQETEGTVIHIVSGEQDERDFQYYIEHKDKLEPTKSALFKLLLDLVDHRITDEEAKEKLDPEILAILAEETNTIGNAVDEILNKSLVKEQTNTRGIEMNDLRRVFASTAKNITENVVDSNYWKIYSSTGLSSTSCEIIRRYVSNNEKVILSLIDNANNSDVMPLLTTILDILNEIPEMEEKKIYDGDYVELLGGWIDGKNVFQLAQEVAYDDTVKIAKFIENYFGYLLPWGISAFLQIIMFIFSLSSKDLSNYVNFLPSMVKYGVPTPEAAWAMSAGVPFRKTAIEMASRYVAESKTSDYKNFLEWVSKIDFPSLRTKYDLRTPVLEDVTDVLGRSGVNPMLKSLKKVEEVLSKPIWIAGIKYDNHWIPASRVKEGDTVGIERDFDNLYDRNAIRVTLKGEEIGFIERNLAQFLAPNLDCGLEINGKIIHIDKRRKIPEIEIQIQIIQI